MLDNIVTEKTMASMPIEILANAKDKTVTVTSAATNSDQPSIGATPVTKSNKTKTILNWLKNSTTNNNNTNNKTLTLNKQNNNNKNSNSIKTNSAISDNKEIIKKSENNSSTKNCTCPKAKQPNNTRSGKETEISPLAAPKTVSQKEDDSLREFRGVQTLKHFWNKRITANRESALRAKGSKQQFTKSVSCLVNAISTTGEPPPLTDTSPSRLSQKDLLQARKLRALSLHDCSRNSPDFDEISLSDIEIQKHLEKDNFYKYKTAEQASKLRELSEHSSHKKLSNGIILPAGQKSERFDWLKRYDKFSRKKSAELTLNPPAHMSSTTKTNTLTSTDNGNLANTSAALKQDIFINEHKMHTQDSATAIGQDVAAEVGTNHHQNSETSTPTLTAASSPQLSVSRRRATTRKDSTKTSASSISRDSSTTSLALSANSHKTLVKRNSSARKYSFKTHSRSYHAPRKMLTNKESVNSGSSSLTNPNTCNNKVAKLTQQFNEIIQKDKTLLEEIKRKHGVLMTHKGHVYKVVDRSSLNRKETPSISRNSSKTQDISFPQINNNSVSSTVQKNIKKFESESRGLKPKVPLKSLQVLKKSNELVINKIKVNPNRLNNKLESETKSATKPQTLGLSSTLEIVQEETKTPLEQRNQETNLRDFEKAYKESEQNESTKPKVLEDINKSRENDEFLAMVPAKIDSVIYKSIHKTKQKDLQKPKQTPEVIQTQQKDLEKPKEIPEVHQTLEKDLQKRYEQAEDLSKHLLNNVSLDNPDIKGTNASDKENLGKPEKQNEDKESTENPSNTENTNNETNPSNELNTETKTTLTDSAIPLYEDVEHKSNTKDYSNETPASPQPLEDEDKSKRKHKYAKIYEKLRFFTPFSQSNKKQKQLTSSPSTTDLNTTPDLTSSVNNISTTKDPDFETYEKPEPLDDRYIPMSPSPKPLKEATEYSPMYNPEAKLLDALEQVDKKLQNLSHDNDRTLESDEYGQPLQPNSSFLHKINAKDNKTQASSSVIQAVNVTLVNAIEGEQMIMEQKEIQQQEQLEKESPEPPLLPPKKKTQEEEPLYEPICVDEVSETKTEKSYNNSEIKTAKEENFSSPPQLEEEDIYQTVEEAKDERDNFSSLKTKEIVINPIPPELDGYEPIENPDDSISSTKCHPNASKALYFDGYEEYTPSVELLSSTTPSSTSCVRKVTDELPDLPKPKRILPKSPIPIRTAPKPPLPKLQSTETESQEPNYYGGEEEEENIYDTIKGPHCYESLQCVSALKQNSSPSSVLRDKNVDCVSLSSNCYESISHFKHANILSQHSGGSSNGSTLTMSSENKTNSLYEGSLTSSLHYASKRIYSMGANGQKERKKSSTDVNGYGGSVGRTSDTSDEWTDVSDNESGDASGKPQFIIVRERSKAHKSPDWSRRVRDKRQRKSKSCIEDDDPDHYYEQLSPLALSKRHSLLEETRANSLQRNQGSVRVSKRGKQMSYSAHALGQHISDDSFDSDTDYYEDSEHFKNSHNDSGVDIRTTKLPDPPTSSNQMYSFVKKFKNFIVNKKSPNSSKNGDSQQKIYDSSSQFYAGGQYEGKSQTSASSSQLQVPETKELSTSEKNLILAQSTVSKPEPLNTSTTPRKSKTGKSLRSRLRKSLVGFDNKQLSTLTPTRSTFYIEDPANDENNGQLDSGFSEKALSGELPTTTSTPTAEDQRLSTLIRKSKKETKLANSQRRRTTIGIRPHEPPPPPPPENTKQKRQSNTSWYAECGVFKNGSTNLISDDTQILNSQNGSSNNSFAAGSTWYEEAGLYQTSGISVASSGSSGVSTSNEACPTDEMSHSMFSNEPLYQIYSAAKLEAISRDMQDESSTDGYEEIGDRLKNGHTKEAIRKSSRPSALQLVEPKSGPERTLWSQIPEVINSYIIPTMTPRERALMEAKFEIITSEASYLKSLNLLRTHYMNHPVFRDQNVVSSRDRKSLFAHIVPVHECSEKLLTELESCWQDNIMLIGLSKRIYAIAEKYFYVYVGFCEHQGRMDRTLKHLREAKGIFSQNLELLESSPSCCGLNLHSFLMLPMQRITRLPLLIDAVFSKCHPNDDEYENWKMCLAIMNKIVTQCNEAANKTEQAFEIERISRQLEFNPSIIRPLAIAPAGVLAPGTKPRYLVKKGELTHLIWRGDDAKLTFGKKFIKSTIFAFLFSDLLVLTKRKAEEQFSVFDYCPRNMLTITSGDSLPQLPTKDLNSQTSKNLILMTLLENHERKTVELLLSCPSVSEQERWLQAMRPPESETPGEKLYEQWDCPQVIARMAYENNEPDSLNLDVGDVVNVTRKLPDGWYKGERIRDGVVGWFPGSYTEEVNSVHVRARNLKQRHRLLTFTATYLESQKRNK